MNMSTTRRQAIALSLGTWFIRDARAADTPRFALGVASGHPRADTLVLWTRLTGEGLPERVEVRWELAYDEAFTKLAASGTEMAEGDWAHSVHAEPTGLQAARSYWYRFTALGQRSAAGRTRTAPAPDADGGTLRLAIASCQRYDHGHFAAWRHLAAQDLDLVLFLGDYIYENPSLPTAVRQHEGMVARTLDQYRARYAQYKSDPALQAAHAAVPWMAVWDDHEVENDYAAGTSPLPDPWFVQRRAAATQAYWEHMPFPKSMRPRGTDMRIYAHYDWGRLARILTVDDRQYRDVQVCPKPLRQGGSNTVALKDCPELLNPKRSLLGMAQERWLERAWDTSRPWNLLAQQTLMARMTWSEAGTYWTDGWDGYAPSRNRLLSAVAERKVPGAVVLGGDVHAHYVADLKADYDAAQSPVVATEFCGTSISSHGMPQARVDAARPLNPHIHYGRSNQRGYIGFAITAKHLEASLYAVAEPNDPASAVSVAARFHVDATKPGAQTG